MSRQANDFATMFMKMMAVMSQQTPGGFPGFPFLTPTPAPTSRSVLNRKLSGSSSEDISPEARSKEKKKREKKKSRSFAAVVVHSTATSEIMKKYPLSDSDIKVPYVCLLFMT